MTPKSSPGRRSSQYSTSSSGEIAQTFALVGFEPNSVHTAYLQTVNAYLKRHALPGLIFAEVAVSSHRGNIGNMPFFTDPLAPKHVHEWGASLAPWHGQTNKSSTSLVQLVDLHNFILDHVLPIVRAQKQKTGKAPPVVMEIDIEGAEFVVMPALMVSGALCHVDLVFAEWHGDRMRLAMPGRSNLTARQMRRLKLCGRQTQIAKSN